MNALAAGVLLLFAACERDVPMAPTVEVVATPTPYIEGTNNLILTYPTPHSGTDIGVLATTDFGDEMRVAFPVVRRDPPAERLLFEATSTKGSLKIHEDGRVETTFPPDEAARQFFEALAFVATAFPQMSSDAPRICYGQPSVPEHGDQPL